MEAIHVPLAKLKELRKAGKTHREIGEQFGVPANAVAQAMHHGRDVDYKPRLGARKNGHKIGHAMRMVNGHDKPEHTNADELVRIGRVLVDMGMKLLDLAMKLLDLARHDQ